MKNRLLFREHRILIRHSERYTLAVLPLEVRIIGSNQPLSAGKRYELVCVTSGSRPPATVTWWRNDQRLVDTKESVSTMNDEKGTMRHRLLRAEDPSMAGRSPASTRKSKSQPLKSVKYLAFPARNIYLSRKEKGGNRTRIQNLALKMIYRMDITFTTSFQEFCASYTSDFYEDFGNFFLFPSIVLIRDITSMILIHSSLISFVIKTQFVLFFSRVLFKQRCENDC